MLQLIQHDNVFERREQKLKAEVNYYDRPPGQFKDEEAMNLICPQTPKT